MNSFPKTDLAALAARPGMVRPLALVSALRFVAAEDLVYAGASTDEIDKMVDAGLMFRFRLQRRMTHETPTDVLAATRKGALTLAQAFSVDADSVPSDTHSSCRRSAMFLDHSLARSRFAIVLARGLEAENSAVVLSWEQDPERLADAVHLDAGHEAVGRQPLVADALAVVAGPRGPEGLLVEIDRGTERPGYLGRKYRGYLEWWKNDGPKRRFDLIAIRILTVAPDAKRVARLVEACRESTEGRAKGLFWFAAESELTAAGITAPVWRTMTAEHLQLWS